MDDIANSKARQPNLLTRLWNGDVPMATVFWGFILIPNLFFKAIEFAFETEYYARGVTDGIIAGALIYWILANSYILFMLFALWRSAGKSPESGIWSYVARAYAGLNGAFVIWEAASIFLT